MDLIVAAVTVGVESNLLPGDSFAGPTQRLAISQARVTPSGMDARDDRRTDLLSIALCLVRASQCFPSVMPSLSECRIHRNGTRIMSALQAYT